MVSLSQHITICILYGWAHSHPCQSAPLYVTFLAFLILSSLVSLLFERAYGNILGCRRNGVNLLEEIEMMRIEMLIPFLEDTNIIVSPSTFYTVAFTTAEVILCFKI